MKNLILGFLIGLVPAGFLLFFPAKEESKATPNSARMTVIPSVKTFVPGEEIEFYLIPQFGPEERWFDGILAKTDPLFSSELKHGGRDFDYCVVQTKNFKSSTTIPPIEFSVDYSDENGTELQASSIIRFELKISSGDSVWQVVVSNPNGL